MTSLNKKRSGWILLISFRHRRGRNMRSSVPSMPFVSYIYRTKVSCGKECLPRIRPWCLRSTSPQPVCVDNVKFCSRVKSPSCHLQRCRVRNNLRRSAIKTVRQSSARYRSHPWFETRDFSLSLLLLRIFFQQVNGGSVPRWECTTWGTPAFKLLFFSVLSTAFPSKSSFCTTLATTICRAKRTERRRLRPPRLEQEVEVVRHHHHRMAVRPRPHARRAQMSVSLAKWTSCSWVTLAARSALMLPR
jgi:hypothetical protein